MATNVVLRTDVSGTSYVLDVAALELSSSLSTLDFEVTHNGIINNSYTKTSATQLTYAGASVVLGTKVVARRVSSVVQSETTFISTTTASALTNALEKLRFRVEELDARLSYTLNQINLGGISIGTIPVNNAAYGASWSTDTNAAPSRASTYTKIETLAPLASPTFTGDPKVPTPAVTDNDTSAVNSAWVKSVIGSVRVDSAGVLYFNTTGSGFLLKFGVNVVTTVGELATINYNGNPQFNVIRSVVVCNGDASASTVPALIQAYDNTAFVLRTPGYSGGYRVNWVALGNTP